MDGTVVRRAEREELPTLAALRWQWGEERGRVAGLDPEVFAAAFLEWAAAHAATHVPFLAERAGRIIGMAWLATVPRVATPRSLDRLVADVQSVYVAPEKRDAGVGGLLVEALLDEARRIGAERVVVHSDPRAVRLYERHGFAVAPVLLQVDLGDQ